MLTSHFFDFNYEGNTENALRVLHLTHEVQTIPHEDPEKVLRIHSQADPNDLTVEKIQTAYRQRSLLYHPDRNPTEVAAFKFGRLREARRIALKVLDNAKLSTFDTLGKNNQAFTPDCTREEAQRAFDLENEVSEDKIRVIYDGFVNEPRKEIEIPREGEDQHVRRVRLQGQGYALQKQFNKPLMCEFDDEPQGEIPWFNQPDVGLDNTMDISHIQLKEKGEWTECDEFVMKDLHNGIEDMDSYIIDDIFAKHNVTLLKF